MAKPDVISDEFIGGRFDRFATFLSDGTLRITEVKDPKPEQQWELTQITLQNWDEIMRLRDFLNKLSPVQPGKESIQHERASA
ncbi:hypothetical protein [Brevibacillus choshinensis]|uniref:Uncharacterized protein n=1 Tax=Brevibacillus choshinensis TaxID=54911 RepID=A0ABX7FRY6_BRECH|nr:hypothetical protein [Brevibacillus choshinensis]QRG68565.1 hypothetical protein JNE38_05265 [Brevibacillus choshinensis]